MEKTLTKQDILDLFAVAEKRSAEADKRSAEANKMSAEANKRSAEAEKRFEKRSNKLESLFTGQWGKLIESLVAGDLVNLLKQRGIDVKHTALRLKRRYNGRQMEIDIIAINRTEIVAVEVKTTLLPDDVNDFIENLNDFKEAFSEYKNMKLYGAVAYLRVESKAEVYADRKGLFVIRATGKSASITNNKNFKPEIF
ncbi:MAG: YraN family protein [Cytophagales bacterium]|nr:YraN family protein [Cytophagales bacterium]